MKMGSVMPVVAAVLLVAACGEDGGPTDVDTAASVRFFNATTGMTGSGGFTANGQFAAGSALAFGQSTQACSTVEAGSASFGFGAADAGGAALSGDALATLDNQAMTAGEDVTVVAAGPAAGPTLFLLSNNFSGTLASNQAAVRFVNLAPEAPLLFNVFTGVLGSGGTMTAPNIAVGAPTAFDTVTSGSNAFTILNGHNIVIQGSAATLNLPAGTVNTIAIVPGTVAGSYQLVNIPRCS